MRYLNLKAEMARNGIKVADLAKPIAKSKAYIEYVLYGKGKLYFDDALKIRDAYFPGTSLEYLFEKAK